MCNNNIDNTITYLQDIDPDDMFFDEINASLNIDQQSKYFNIDKYNSKFGSRSEGMALINFNIRSYFCNREAFFGFMGSLCHSPQIICLTETWLHEGSVAEGRMEGYRGFHTFRDGRRGGGVSLFVSRDMQAHKIDQLSLCTETIESCVVSLSIGKDNLKIVAIYRPHSDSIENFSDALNSLLLHELLTNSPIIVTGDFNIDLLRQEVSRNILNFINNMQSLQMFPRITKPTRFPPDGTVGEPSLIDHIWFNRLLPYQSGILCIDITDHLPTFLRLPYCCKPPDRIRIETRPADTCGKLRFRDSLIRFNWDATFSADINESFDKFMECLNILYYKHFPIKIKYIGPKRFCNPWLTRGLMTSIKTKSRYYKLVKLNLITAEFYKNYKNHLTCLVKKAKSNFYLSKFNACRNNIKKTWKLLKHILCKDVPRDSIKSILIDDGDVTDSRVIAEHFRDYFSSVALDLDASIPVATISPISYMKTNVVQSLFLRPVSNNECIEVINKLKSVHCGTNDIPADLIKQNIDILAPVMV
ncbi:hypothetical protein SNEBB_006345, partial [Seison nebaliae]